MLQRHILPSIGAVPLLKLAPQHLTAFYAEKRQHGKVNGTGGLSSRSVRMLHNIIHEALDWAVKQQIIVTDAIDAPKFSYKEKHVWSAVESRRLLAAAADHVWGPLFPVLLTTGMRRGECLAALARSRLAGREGAHRAASDGREGPDRGRRAEDAEGVARRDPRPFLPGCAQRAPHRAARDAVEGDELRITI